MRQYKFNLTLKEPRTNKTIVREVVVLSIAELSTAICAFVGIGYTFINSHYIGRGEK